MTSPHLHTAVHEPLLGTRVSVGVRADDAQAATTAEQLVVQEIDRLERLLSAYRPSSEWNRWRVGALPQPGPEVTAVLLLAQRWHRVSRGAFNPQAGVLRARWLQAERDGHAPSPDELAELAASIGALPYRVDGTVVVRLGDCADLDHHALAKGWIVDRAVEAALAVPGVLEVLVNAGGDLRHVGGDPITVGIEDPRRPFDNAAPLATVHLGDGGLAASSGARRPMRIAGSSFSHVLDPRTGLPVRHTLSATAIAGDACSADVAATIVGVLPIAEALAWADATDGASCHLLDADGGQHSSARWPA